VEADGGGVLRGAIWGGIPEAQVAFSRDEDWRLTARGVWRPSLGVREAREGGAAGDLGRGSSPFGWHLIWLHLIWLGIRPRGVAAVLAQNPLHRPGKIKKSPAPFVHAATKAMRQFLWEGYALFVAAYRSAAERLKAGDPAPPFPVGCFPPASPFVGG
jgi:hypothetical protein